MFRVCTFVLDIDYAACRIDNHDLVYHCTSWDPAARDGQTPHCSLWHPGALASFRSLSLTFAALDVSRPVAGLQFRREVEPARARLVQRLAEDAHEVLGAVREIIVISELLWTLEGGCLVARRDGKGDRGLRWLLICFHGLERGGAAKDGEQEEEMRHEDEPCCARKRNEMKERDLANGVQSLRSAGTGNGMSYVRYR